MDDNGFTRTISLDGGINFRDLGGYRSIDGKTIRWRKLFRSGHLANITKNDISRLSSFGLMEIHDFRRENEQLQSPTVAVPFKLVDDYQMSIGDISKFWEFLAEGKLSSGSAHELVVNSYKSCIKDVIPSFRRLMRALVDNGGQTTLFHCSAGKDRTGMAAALILSCLSIPREIIVDDYLLTKKYYKPDRLISIIEGHLKEAKISSWDRDWLTPYVSVHEQNINAFLDAIDMSFGSMKVFLSDGLALSDQDILQLQDNFLE